MSAKFLHVVTDENPELKKQIGCMAGIFQIFDRQNLVSGRRINGRGHKKTTSGPVLSTSASMGAEHVIGSPKIILEKNLSKSFNENQRISMELSTTSSSSTSCSSFSSIELRKTGQREVQDKSSKNSPRLKAPNSPNACRSLDFQDVVKESINRDSCNLSVKIMPKEEVTNRSFKHIDSPRPIDIDESIRVLVKLKEPPWNFSELKESPRPSFEQAHRFSYDGREISRQSLDSREHGKLQHRFRDLPRLSLDSKECSLKNSNFEPKPNTVLKDFDRRDRKLRVSQDSNDLISPKRNSSVVAKLMGLEDMPSLSIVTQDPYHEPKPKPLKAFEANKEDRPLKDPDLIMKPASNSRVPIETAPWKKEKHPAPQQAKFRHREESVYSEIEKRLKELEFRQSNKDLRALKQILDAMQAKGLLEAKKIDQTTTRDDQNRKKFESPIVIMKPAYSVKRSGATVDKTNGSVINRVAKDQIANAGLNSNRIVDDYGPHKVRSSKLQVSSKPQNSGSSLKNSGSLSPRLQQKRIEAEREPQRASDNKKLLESVSPRGKLRQKQARVQNNDEQLSESNAISQRSDNNISLTSNADIEVASAYRSVDNSSIFNQGNRSPSAKAATKAASIEKQKKSSIGFGGEVSSMEFVTAAPSPISVLDASLHHDDLSPSPLKNSNTQDEKNQNSNPSTEINKKKLRNIENLVQKLASLTPGDDKISSTDHIASLCKTQNPNHRYISEILLASGLLFKDLNFQPISQINPELFLVLEETKPSKPKNDQDKIHRKLVFDLVNEVLMQKLELTSSGKFPCGQKLLKELCIEFDQLQATARGECDDEIKINFHRSEGWENFEKEKQGFVLEIERSIFKDLIDEVVSGEISRRSQCKSSRRQRQLFVK